ncbi:unnamed protein product [Bemisia tabaci]|uniref:Ionotropic receptor n=1 Tax=Bemisia tabaci TaxID=7038 RepID=A0A9P0A4G6_BEMTA|nr:unnamed protein product [Bemisia tabaci]
MANHWLLFLLGIFDDFVSSMNCTLEYISVYQDIGRQYDDYRTEIGQKYGVHLQTSNTIGTFENADSSDADFSVSVDSSLLCLVTPHSQLMPQYLVIFKTFTPIVWACILATILIFVLMQYVFQFSQRQTFRRFYSDAELDSYEKTSSFLIVYSYFICGSPSTLLLGRLYTGKLLFVIFSFATIIISTVFLNGMTTLLEKQVQYPEIDSLEEMKESEMLIQVEDMEQISNFLQQEKRCEKLATKLTDSLNSATRSIELELMESQEFFIEFFFQNSTFNGFEFLNGTRRNYNLHTRLQNIRMMYGTDAFLESIPEAMISAQSVRILNPIDRTLIDFHLVKEYIMTYPVSYAFLKNSFLFDKFNEKLTQSLEFGHVKRFSQAIKEEFKETENEHTRG